MNSPRAEESKVLLEKSNKVLPMWSATTKSNFSYPFLKGTARCGQNTRVAAGNVSPEDQKSYVGERAPTLREALKFTKKNEWSDAEVEAFLEGS